MAAIGSEFVKLQQLKTAIDSKQPDMTGVLKYAETGLTADGEAVSLLVVGDFEAAPSGMAIIHGGSTGTGVQGYGGVSNSQLFTIGANNSSASVTLDCGDHNFYTTVTNESTEVQLDSKSITSITDAISDAPDGNALVTDKAVADYVTALVATDEEFDSVFGL